MGVTPRLGRQRPGASTLLRAAPPFSAHARPPWSRRTSWERRCRCAHSRPGAQQLRPLHISFGPRSLWRAPRARAACRAAASPAYRAALARIPPAHTAWRRAGCFPAPTPPARHVRGARVLRLLCNVTLSVPRGRCRCRWADAALPQPHKARHCSVGRACCRPRPAAARSCQWLWRRHRGAGPRVSAQVAAGLQQARAALRAGWRAHARVCVCMARHARVRAGGRIHAGARSSCTCRPTCTRPRCCPARAARCVVCQTHNTRTRTRTYTVPRVRLHPCAGLRRAAFGVGLQARIAALIAGVTGTYEAGLLRSILQGTVFGWQRLACTVGTQRA
jgi:hypothetical protein